MDRVTPGLGQDDFFGYSYYFSNATQLGCLFTKIVLQCVTHISVHNVNRIKHTKV